MSKSMAPDGPFTVTIEFNLTDGDQIAKASYECPPGVLPTAEMVTEAARQVRKQIHDQLNDSFRWMGRHEFVQDAMSERTFGVKFAVPGPDKFGMDFA